MAVWIHFSNWKHQFLFRSNFWIKNCAVKLSEAHFYIYTIVGKKKKRFADINVMENRLLLLQALIQMTLVKELAPSNWKLLPEQEKKAILPLKKRKLLNPQWWGFTLERLKWLSLKWVMGSQSEKCSFVEQMAMWLWFMKLMSRPAEYVEDVKRRDHQSIGGWFIFR